VALVFLACGGTTTSSEPAVPCGGRTTSYEPDEASAEAAVDAGLGGYANDAGAGYRVATQ
jgi:hypothetical protein